MPLPAAASRAYSGYAPADGMPPPGGPMRTLAAFIAEEAPVSEAVARRLMALDEGRHASLAEMRLALGADLDFSRVGPAGLEHPIDIELATDAELAALLDVMYRAIASPRMVRGTLDASGFSAAHAGEALRLREGERLRLLAFADNRTGEGIEFSAESHGEGIGGWIEPQRTGSALLDAGAMPAGSYLLPVMLVAAGHPATADVPIECARAGLLHVRIIDAATGERCAARVYLRDDVGEAWPDGAAIRRDERGGLWFHADGSFTARVSGTARLRIARGIEYDTVDIAVTVPPDGEATAEARLERWSDMAADGWYSGDVHVHLHYGGEYALTPADASLAQRAEDVHFLNMMVANSNSGAVLDRDLFEGAPHALSDGRYILRWGEEYRNNFYGHMCMYGIDALVEPIFSGFRNSAHPHDWPANAVAAAGARAAAGALGYAHPLFGSGALDRVFAPEAMRSVEAKEMPVDAALGRIDAIDLLSYPGDADETAMFWYRLLNCGLRIAATAGTDTFMNVYDSTDLKGFGERHFSNPPAGQRVFVRTEGAFSTASWCDGVRRGRTFVTNGPMLALSCNGAQIGDAVEARAGDLLRIEAAAGSRAPFASLELVVNGAVVASAPATDGGGTAALAYDLRAERSCWVAVRARGLAHALALGGAVYAHTSPIYITVDGAAQRSADDAAYFHTWIERLIAMAQERGRYADGAQRDAVIALFREGQRYYSA